MYKQEKIKPYEGQGDKGKLVEEMFDNIAPTYDTLNHRLSWDIDKGWRKKAIKQLAPFRPQKMLDIATGTGDFAILSAQMLHPLQLIGTDISEGMMEEGRQKVEKAGLSAHITFERQDCTALTYEDNRFDAVTAAFGVRNFERIEQGIAEMYRVLKPGGHLMILELSTPEHFPMAQSYHLYSSVFIPLIGRVLAHNKAAYHYLPASIKVVPQGRVMTELLQRVGFKEAHAQTFTFGVCSMYTGTK